MAYFTTKVPRNVEDTSVGGYVLAKALGLAPEGVRVMASLDPKAMLIVRSEDDPDVPYALVTFDRTTRVGSFIGWAWGYEVKQRHNWRSHWRTPAYGLEQGMLKTVGALGRLLNGTWWLDWGAAYNAVVTVQAGRIAAHASNTTLDYAKPFTALLASLREQPNFRSKRLPRPDAQPRQIVR